MCPRHDDAAIIVRKTKDVQASVISSLTQYLDLAARMREFEDTFSAQILGVAGELVLLRRKRRNLEAEYGRIKNKLDEGKYHNADEIAEDVGKALESADVDSLDPSPGRPEDTDPYEAERFDTATRQRIVRAFKRIVLHSVHPDTSDAEYSEFEAAYSAYQARDYTLMEAFVIRYRGEVGFEEDGQLLTLAQLTTRLSQYQAAEKRLDARLRALQRNATPAELNSPEQAIRRIEEQGEKFQQAITEEAERVRNLQNRLRALGSSTNA